MTELLHALGTLTNEAAVVVILVIAGLGALLALMAFFGEAR